ncbi:unnamed protein product [Lupinus luteus]|uniref:F-box domain-containing protein n=1 Tax=Lupinus luteus TaxID=3873 RepID=A0AAV1XA99_LUPLU
MKRQRESERDINDIDRLSDLPDFVLLHIMEFMDIKDVVQTCILSKRWKNLWKSMTNLTLHCLDDGRTYTRVSPLEDTDQTCILSFSKFVSRILSDRDGSLHLQHLDFAHRDTPEITLLEVMEYAASHNVQQFRFPVEFYPPHTFELPLSILCCRSLTFLKLDFWIFSSANNKRLSNHGSMKTQHPCFSRLKSVKVERGPLPMALDDKGISTVKYLLQNSPLAKVDIITCFVVDMLALEGFVVDMLALEGFVVTHQSSHELQVCFDIL